MAKDNKKKTVKTAPKKEVVEEEVKEAVVEEVEEEAPKAEKKSKMQRAEKEETLLHKIVNIVLWIVLFVWMGICLVDFYNVHQQKDPMFCIKKETTQYSDGTVDSCLGVGYKIYNYKRASFRAIEFGPFWSTDRTAENNK